MSRRSTVAAIAGLSVALATAVVIVITFGMIVWAPPTKPKRPAPQPLLLPRADVPPRVKQLATVGAPDLDEEWGWGDE